MPFTATYAAHEPSREALDARVGDTLVEFGAPWCGHCRAIQAPLAAALEQHPALRHMKIEDGPRRPLGRSFRVRLWPTLILLRAGRELARLVRPDAAEIRQTLARIGAGAGSNSAS